MPDKETILITGATGFIGSTLTEICVSNGFDVIAFDRYNPNNHWGWLEQSEYKSGFSVILGDIRDYDSVYAAMENCSTVFHLAALGGIPYSYISPLAYIRTNIEGTYNVLEAARHLGLSQVLVTSTSETYGTAQYTPIDEHHPCVAQSPYAATKISADQLAISYHRSFGLPVKIVRPFNTYGPRQSARAIIPTIIGQLLDGKNTISLGNTSPTRDLTYVDDTCNAFLEVYKSNRFLGEVINVGTNSEISIADLAYLVADLLNKQLTIEISEERERATSSEVQRLVCDNSKLLSQSSWKPAHSLRQGLSNVIEWMSDPNNAAYYKSDRYNV